MDDPRTNAYIADMLAQPDCLRRLNITDVSRAIAPIAGAIGNYRHIILTGMGSSYSALRPMWLALVETGHPAWLVDTAECLGHFAPMIDASTLVIAASQSGRSAEIVALAEQIRSRGGTLLAITNDPASPLAQHASAIVDIGVGIENSVSTKTYLNTLGVGLAISRIVLQRGHDDVLERTADLLDSYLESWRQRTEEIKAAISLPERLYFLARGQSLATAEYGALIAKEAARWPVEALNGPQFRHGPLELADERLTAVILAGTDAAARQHNLALHNDLLGFGARSFWLDTGVEAGPLAIPRTAADAVCIVEAVPLQLLSVALAEQSGISAGSFRHLKKVTTVL